MAYYRMAWRIHETGTEGRGDRITREQAIEKLRRHQASGRPEDLWAEDWLGNEVTMEQLTHAAPPREWTAEDVSDEQERAIVLSTAEAGSSKESIAAACNVMGVPKPQAVDVEALAAKIVDAVFFSNDDDRVEDQGLSTGEVVAKILRRELPAAVQPDPSELDRLRLVEAAAREVVESHWGVCKAAWIKYDERRLAEASGVRHEAIGRLAAILKKCGCGA
jgi:hypothetical protein